MAWLIAGVPWAGGVPHGKAWQPGPILPPQPGAGQMSRQRAKPWVSGTSLGMGMGWGCAGTLAGGSRLVGPMAGQGREMETVPVVASQGQGLMAPGADLGSCTLRRVWGGSGELGQDSKAWWWPQCPAIFLLIRNFLCNSSLPNFTWSQLCQLEFYIH